MLHVTHQQRLRTFIVPAPTELQPAHHRSPRSLRRASSLLAVRSVVPHFSATYEESVHRTSSSSSRPECSLLKVRMAARRRWECLRGRACGEASAGILSALMTSTWNEMGGGVATITVSLSMSSSGGGAPEPRGEGSGKGATWSEWPDGEAASHRL